jgi:hypothetical protein
MKQANEFGIISAGQKFSTIVLYLPFAKGIGPKLGQRHLCDQLVLLGT